jgi:hypothetical protein
MRDPFLPPQPRSSENGATAVELEGRPATGSLVVLDSGVKAINHVTLEAQRFIERADKVLCHRVDPVTERWIHTLNEKIEPSHERSAGDDVLDSALRYVRMGLSVCVVYDGNPALGGSADVESMKKLRAEGYRAVTLPSISRDDCLCSDLGLDPSSGYQTYGVSAFMSRESRPDVSCALVLWTSGEVHFPEGLIELLTTQYGPQHEVTLYQPARYTVCEPMTLRCALDQVARTAIAGTAALYIPPLKSQGGNI